MFTSESQIIGLANFAFVIFCAYYLFGTALGIFLWAINSKAFSVYHIIVFPFRVIHWIFGLTLIVVGISMFIAADIVRIFIDLNGHRTWKPVYRAVMDKWTYALFSEKMMRDDILAVQKEYENRFGKKWNQNNNGKGNEKGKQSSAEQQYRASRMKMIETSMKLMHAEGWDQRDINQYRDFFKQKLNQDIAIMFPKNGQNKVQFVQEYDDNYNDYPN